MIGYTQQSHALTIENCKKSGVFARSDWFCQ